VVGTPNGKPLSEIIGISYRDANGKKLSITQIAQMWMTWIPFPTSLMFITENGCAAVNVPFLLYPFVALYTTRGCPAQCTFCSGHRL